MDSAKKPPIKPIALKTANGIEMFDYPEVVYFEGDRNASHVSALARPSKIRVMLGLLEIEETFAHPALFRCHKSYIVNLWHIKCFNEKERKLLMVNNDTISVSEDIAPQLKKLLLGD